MDDPDELGHWEGIFQAREDDIPPNQAEAILSHVQPASLDTIWEVSWEEFEEFLAAKREFAPGTDGLPYTVYR